ncbi:hypothetical protein ACTFIY_002845 [Dictyostelium cf. discoideum]
MASSQLRLTKDRISRMDKEERLRLAVDHYKQNFENITQEEVGKHFDVPSYEISRKMNCTSVKKHNRLLLAEQEKSLLKDLEEIINNNIAVTKEMVLDMVLSLYKERTGITKESISNEWWREFKQRNPNIKLKNISFQDKARLEAEKTLDIKAFWQKIWDVVTTKQISPEFIFNVDEKGVVFTKAKKRVIVIEKIDDKLLKENKTIALYNQKQNQILTMVPWVNAMGQALNVYYILQMPDTLKMEITIPKHYGTLYINNSGYMDYDLKKRMMIDFLDKLDHAKPKLILVDNHVSNYFEGASELNKKYNVNIMTFPANTTHLLQPLDNVPFSPFSSHLSKLIVKYLSPDEKGKRHNITSEQYLFCVIEHGKNHSLPITSCKLGQKLVFSITHLPNLSIRGFCSKRKPNLQNPQINLSVINTNQEIVVHTPIITKETISAMRKHKTDGCDLTKETNKSLTLVQNNFQINNNNLIQISTPPTPTNLPQFNTTQQISTSQYSLSTGITNLDQKIALAIKDILKKKK